MMFILVLLLLVPALATDLEKREELRKLFGRQLQSCSSDENGCKCLTGCDMFFDAGIECGGADAENEKALGEAMTNADDLTLFMCDLLKCGSYCAKNQLDCVDEWKIAT